MGWSGFLEWSQAADPPCPAPLKHLNHPTPLRKKNCSTLNRPTLPHMERGGAERGPAALWQLWCALWSNAISSFIKWLKTFSDFLLVQAKSFLSQAIKAIFEH